MKKIVNDPNHVVQEMLEGFLAAYGNLYSRVEEVSGIIRKEIKNKVGLVVGGGSGHEPLFIGFAGEGLADGVAMGNVFAAPTPDTIYKVTKAVDNGNGVLYVYGNYAGDVLNFDMGAELAGIEGIEVKTVLVRDDVASAPPERMEDRRGISGDVFVVKIAGAATSIVPSLDKVARITQKAADNTRSIGIALTPGSIPSVGKPTFTIPDDEMEFGMGLHGEPGIRRTKMMKADELTTIMIEQLYNDYPLKEGDEVAVLINGLGSTTLMELLIINRCVSEFLRERKIIVYDTDIHSYCTTQEMGGMSISLLKLDDELKKYYDYPAFSPYYTKNK